MYEVNRILPIVGTQQETPQSGDIVSKLSNLEGRLDEAIALKRLSAVESRVDGMLKKLNIDPASSTARLDKMNTKLDSMLGKLETAKPTVVVPKPLPITKRNIAKAKLGNKSIKNLDLVFQVSTKSQPLLILGVVKSLRLAGLNVSVRLHHHSSVINKDEEGFLFKSLLTAFQIEEDKHISRRVADYDYVFTFLLTNRLDGHDIDLTLHNSTMTPIHSDKNCAKLVWKLAGGVMCDESLCDFWLERVNAALTDKTQTDGIKKQIAKNYNETGGNLCDVIISVLNG